MIYLDYAADTPADRKVLDEFYDVTLRYPANPNALHTLGRQAGERLDKCTAQIAGLLKLKDSEVIYTSGATEANNLAIKGVAEKYRSMGRHIITTYLEHASVNGAVAALVDRGFEVDYVDPRSDGRVDMDHFRSLLRRDTILVSVCYVDSELGITQNIDEIAGVLAGYPACKLHVDATQAVGKIPLALERADLFSFSPHKFYGLSGSGVLVKKENVLLEPQMHGGLSTTPYRSGSPALAQAAACAKALDMALPGVEARLDYVRGLNRKLRDALAKFPKVKMNSTEFSVPHILNISLPGVKTELFREELNKLEVYLSTRSACCAPNSVSRPVYAVTKDRKRATATLRISLSHLTTIQELDDFLSRFKECYDKL